MMMKIGYFVVLLCSFGNVVHAGDNKVEEFKEIMPQEFTNWEDWHMSVEHQMDKDSYSAEAFFQLHTTSDPLQLTSKDILRMYGLARDEVIGQGDGMGGHDETESISNDLKQRIVKEVFETIDAIINDGVIRQDTVSLQDWIKFKSSAGKLPDFGIGPGHEFEFEEEYEKHHWTEHHSESDPDITQWHREDVEHELLHHFHEIEHDHDETTSGGNRFYQEKELLLNNIPLIYRSK